MGRLGRPELVHEDSYLAFAAGIWFYMSPQDPKPSMHDVMTGYFVPNEIDDAANIEATFGATTNIINGGLECGPANQKAANRADYYSNWLDFFGMPAESGLLCEGQQRFPSGGTGDVPGYWEQKWNGETACMPVGYQTPYDINAPDDYKRCVCDKFGQGAADCPMKDPNDVDEESEEEEEQETEEEEPSEDEESADEEESEEEEEEEHEDWEPIPPIPDEWQTDLTLAEIKENPHYPDGSPSRTLFQVDRELDFIEDKLLKLYIATVEAGLISE